MQRSRKLITGGALALAVLVGGGAAIAGTSGTSPQSESKTLLDDVAGRIGVQPAALEQALEDAYKAQIDAEVAAGNLDKERGEALKARIDGGEVPLLGLRLRGGHERGVEGDGDGKLERHERGGHGGPRMLLGIDAAATYLGLSEQELHEQLRAGKSLAEVATAQGKTADGLKAALTDALTTKLDEAVAAGKLTEERKAELLAKATEHLDDLIAGKLPERIRGEHRFEGPGAPPDAPLPPPDAPDAPDAPTVTETAAVPA